MMVITYKCDRCGKSFEELTNFSDDATAIWEHVRDHGRNIIKTRRLIIEKGDGRDGLTPLDLCPDCTDDLNLFMLGVEISELGG